MTTQSHELQPLRSLVIASGIMSSLVLVVMIGRFPWTQIVIGVLMVGVLLPFLVVGVGLSGRFVTVIKLFAWSTTWLNVVGAILILMLGRAGVEFWFTAFGIGIASFLTVVCFEGIRGWSTYVKAAAEWSADASG